MSRTELNLMREIDTCSEPTDVDKFSEAKALGMTDKQFEAFMQKFNNGGKEIL